jgi:AcrR family transcriptional regulator
MSNPPLTAAHAKPLRSDGAEARARLLDAALTLFAEKGFSKTSTREIAQAAQVNVASISYYFGDKAGLYRAVWVDARCNADAWTPSLGGAPPTVEQAITGTLRGFVEPIKQGPHMQMCMKLYFREMLEPTGVWQEEIDTHIKPAHVALVAVLVRHLGLPQADDAVHRLGFAIAGLGIMLHVSSDVISAVRPQLLATPSAIDAYAKQLSTYAIALVDTEARRRTAGAATQSPTPTPTPAPPKTKNQSRTSRPTLAPTP